MKLAVIDASPIGGGPVTRALDCTASEARHVGGDVTRLRVYDLFVTCCSTCTACAVSGRCTRRIAPLDDALRLLGSSDCLVVGTAGHLHARDPRCEALLRRLVGGFAHVETCRGFGRHNSRAGACKRAALISSAPPLLGFPALLGLLPAGLGSVWRVLDRAGVDVVGCTAVGTHWSGPDVWDRTRERARRLGRVLAAGAPMTAPPVAPVPEPVPLPAAVALPAVRSA
ncbi:MAG: hypothetical protein Q7W30_01185 [Coriobacteriia bacterium]|nr:hypothetical protein [Coriobacteriia bacterium]